MKNRSQTSHCRNLDLLFTILWYIEILGGADAGGTITSEDVEADVVALLGWCWWFKANAGVKMEDVVVADDVDARDCEILNNDKTFW